MRVVRLNKMQNEMKWVSSPIFAHALVKTDEENANLLRRFLQDPSLQDEAFLSNLHLVRNTVGRYLFHWPETKRFEEDMISVGVTTLLEMLVALKPKQVDYFRAKAIIHIKGSIETFLNYNQSNVTASHMTNHRRIKEGRPIASKTDHPLNYED
jgi:DNA-directed RNA polymerase specialized sigma subunit